jgi:hypothetical protein
LTAQLCKINKYKFKSILPNNRRKKKLLCNGLGRKNILKSLKKKEKKSEIAYRCDVGLLGGNAGLFPLLRPYGVRGVTGNAGVSGRDPENGEKSWSVSERYDENDSSLA